MEGSSEEMRDEAKVSPGEVHDTCTDQVVNTKTKEIIFKLSETLLFPRGCCIYKCHEVLRKLNEKAYTPQVISIGPFHHGRENLQSMEIIKRRYLQSFIKRQDTVDLWKLITGTIQRMEGNIRKSYSEPIPLGMMNAWK